MNVIPIEYMQAFSSCPELCLDGLLIYDENPTSPYSVARFPSRRQLLLTDESVQKVLLCCEHIREHGIPKGAHSYGYKHFLERVLGWIYITNGQGMLAALICGYRLKRVRDTQNCKFLAPAMSNKGTK